MKLLFPVVIYLCKLNNKNARKLWNMSKINKKRHQNDVNWHEHTVNWRSFGVFLFNLKHASCSTVSYVKFKLVMLLPLFYFYGSSQCLFKFKITCKRASFIKVKSDSAMSVSSNLISLQPTFWCSVMATKNPMFLSIPSSDIFRVNRCQNI